MIKALDILEEKKNGYRGRRWERSGMSDGENGENVCEVERKRE